MMMCFNANKNASHSVSIPWVLLRFAWSFCSWSSLMKSRGGVSDGIRGGKRGGDEIFSRRHRRWCNSCLKGSNQLLPSPLENDTALNYGAYMPPTFRTLFLTSLGHRIYRAGKVKVSLQYQLVQITTNTDAPHFGQTRKQFLILQTIRI